MKTSTWVTVACIVISVVLVLLMLGLIKVPTTESTPSTSVETSVSSAAKTVADERAGSVEFVKFEDAQSAPAEDLIEKLNKEE